MDNFDLKTWFDGDHLPSDHLENDALQTYYLSFFPQLTDIIFETSENDRGSAVIYKKDHEDKDEVFDESYKAINQEGNDCNSLTFESKFKYTFSAGVDQNGDKFIRLSYETITE